MNLQIGVRYTCLPCGIRDREVKVPARTTEDVVHWVEKVAAVAIGADHMATSPHCRATHMTNIKIPMDGTDRVGGAPLQ